LSALPLGARAGGESGHEDQLGHAAQLVGERRQLVQAPPQQLPRGPRRAAVGGDERRAHPVAGGTEPVLGDHLVGHARCRALGVRPHQAPDERGERGRVEHARLRVHDPHLHRAEMRPRPRVPPEVAGIRQRAERSRGSTAAT